MELYEFIKQIDVIVIFCLIYGMCIFGIVSCVIDIISSIKRGLKKRKDKKQEIKEQSTEE